MSQVKTVVRYACGKCSSEYYEKADAEQCNALPLPEQPHAVGDHLTFEMYSVSTLHPDEETLTCPILAIVPYLKASGGHGWRYVVDCGEYEALVYKNELGTYSSASKLAPGYAMSVISDYRSLGIDTILPN